MKLIALVGKKRVGKDTCAELIKSKYSGSVIYQLAQPIKEILLKTRPAEMNHLVYADFDGLGIDREADLGISLDDARKWLLRAASRVKSEYPMLFLSDFYDGSKLHCEVVDIINKISDNENHQWTIRLLLTTLGTDIFVNKINRLIWCALFVREFKKHENDDGCFIVPDIRQESEIELVRNMRAQIIHIHRDTGIQSSHSTEQGLEPCDGETVILNNGTLEEYHSKILAVI